jgi:CubicO group peptidase (beta-lactamase class C family)
MNSGLSGLSAQVDALFAWIQPDAPGAAVIILHNGEAVYEAFFGSANIKTNRRLGPRDSFRLASLTKQFTALAVVILAHKGKLKYDDDVRRILPEFSAYPRKISVRHLLHHTSGLEDFELGFAAHEKLDKDYPRSVEHGRSEFEPQTKDVVALLALKMLQFTPGDEWEYSNSGYVLLAQIVERVSGRPFSEFIDAEIFSLLQMNRSVVSDSAFVEIPNRVVGYVKDKDEYHAFDYTPFDLIYGHDAIYSTAEDMVSWCRSFQREEILEKTALSQSFRTGYLNTGATIGYGFGWFVGKSLGLNRGSHTGSWAGFRHLIDYYPKQRFTLLVLTNCAGFDDVSRSATASAVARIYLSEDMALPVETKVSHEILCKYVGKYELSSGQFLHVGFEGQSLLVEPAPFFPLRLVPESEVKFFVAGAEGDSYFFHRDDRGTVIGLTRYLSLFGHSRDASAIARKVD